MSFFESDCNGKVRCNRKSLHQPRVNVKETIKVSEILDPFGNLRYKVALTSFDLEDDGKYILKYEVQVINYFSTPNPLVIIDRPEPDEPPIYDYFYALNLYNEYVKTYTALIRAETRDFQDITIYKEKIGYKETKPACCATCQWCRKKVTPGKYVYQDTGKLECTNPENGFQYNNDLEDFTQPIRRCPDHWNRRQHQCDCQHIDVYPNVDPFGICEHYLLKTRQEVPVPGQDITEFIDIRLGQRLDTKMCAIAENVISTGLTNDLSVPIIQVVNTVLSGSEASVSLSSPVVNLIANSKEINTQTINVLGNTISTDIMLEPMTTAISNVFKNTQTSAMIDSPLAGMISAVETSAAIIKVVS